MRIKLWLALILTLMVLVFIVQNTEEVTIYFLFWQFSLSRALMLMLVFLSGAATGMLALASRRPKGKSKPEFSARD